MESSVVHDKVVMEDIGRLNIAQQILRKKHGLLETDRCTSRRNGRSHPVVRLPTLQLLPFGGLLLVGFDRTRTAKIERRSIAANQSESLQSARSTVGACVTT